MKPEDLMDQGWRMRNLYYCRDEASGQKLAFRMRAEQEVILRHMIESPLVPIYIVKSRRLGMSTLVDTFMSDCAAWQSGFRGVIIDQKQEDATKKMVGIVRFAYDNLPKEVLGMYETGLKRNDSELRFRLKGEPESTESAIFATTGSRGDTCSMLHVSEWGPIAALDPTRSREIRTGTLPSARMGRRVVETTWAGGKGGDLWELVKPILEKDPNAEGVVYFFPWHSDPAALRLEGFVGSDLEMYFKDLGDKTGKTFSQEQKKWYGAKKLEQGIFIKREYPSTLDEAFSAPVEGSIFGDVIMDIRGRGRIIPFEWSREWPVYSFWDVGWNDSTVVWLAQQVGLDWHWIWHVEVSQHTAAEVVGLLNATGIPIAKHFVPHDAASKAPGEGKNFKDHLEAAGLVNIKKVPRCQSVWDGINHLRSILARSYFRMPQCDLGVVALEAYHTKAASPGGVVAREPVHDWSSHSASAARMLAEAEGLGMIQTMASKRSANLEPLYPDGSVVDLETSMERRKTRRGQATALSGPRPL